MSNGYAYVRNSSDSAYLMIASTNSACGYVVNGFENVCQYYTNVAPRTWVKFPLTDGSNLVAQAEDAPGVWGLWALNTVEVTANTTSGVLCVKPWPVEDVAKADSAKHGGERKPVKQRADAALSGAAG